MKITTSRGAAKMITGMVLTILGAAALLVQAGALAWQAHVIVTDPLGPTAAIGVSSMHALQALAFNPAAVTAVEHRLLVLFSAFIMTLIGFALLRSKRVGVSEKSASPVSRKGGAR